MKFNYYKCPECGFEVDVPTYSRMIAGQKKCFNSECDCNARDYEFKKPVEEVKDDVGS